MLNSVARYLWGGSQDAEMTDGDNSGQRQQGEAAPAAAAAAEVEPQLATQHCEDDEWVLVGLAEQEKENRCRTSSHHHHHQQPNQHPHCPHNHHHHPHSHPHPLQPQHSDGLSQGSSTGGFLAEAEALDDAASLVDAMMMQPSVEEDASAPNFADFDSNYSSDTESSPESVFSACSGRSHATYHPRGHGSEAWVIAPPPCFTGSQVGVLSPVAASPLENLLIEHPSMSVYLSHTSLTSPSSSTTLHSTTGDEQADSESISRTATTTASPHVMSDSGIVPVITSVSVASTTVGSASHPLSRGTASRPPCPRGGVRTASLVHPNTSTQELARITRAAQTLQRCKSQKPINHHQCERINKVRDYQSHPKVKTNSRRNRHMRPSGAKCTRFSQRM